MKLLKRTIRHRLIALFVTLVAQGRHNEANHTFEELIKVDTMSFEWILLVEARFGLSMLVDIPITML